jgi:hypothetical protein
LSQADIASAQAITGGLRGQIVGKNGAPVTGATVKVTSNATGASLTTTSSDNGSFSFTSLSVSGTYNVRINAAGYGAKTLTNIGLSVGETASLNIDMEEVGAAETVVVTGIKAKAAATSIVETSGVSTTFSLADIKKIPTGINNDIKEVIQTSSFAFIDPIGGGDNPPVATMSVAGSNPRCQNFLIDGVQVKDNFGLNAQGYPTARAPIPNEWAEQIQVAPTPYDVEYNDTCGGTINIVTKTGSNEFHGSAYFYYQDASLNGNEFTQIDKKTTSPTYGELIGNDRSSPAPHFVERNYGGTFSGPIIPDKLFFSIGYDELMRTSQPGASAIGPNDNTSFVNRAPGITQAQVDDITKIANDVYGFKAGNLSDVYTEYNQRYMAKLLWQINDHNKLVLSYSHTAGGTLATGGGSTSTTGPSLVLPSNWYRDAEKMETITLHYTGQWTDNLTAEIFLSHLGVRGDQSPLGGTNFPEVYVRTPGANGHYDLGTATASNANSDDGYVVLGPDIYRHWNYLFYKNDSIKPMVTYVLGDHTLKAGFEIHRIGIKNSFTPGAQSVVRFDSISDFQNGILAQTQDKRSNWRSQANGYSVYYSSGQNGNVSGPDANFQFYTESAFIQDEWYPIDHLKVMAGLRYDQYVSSDKPVANPYFLQRYGFSNQINVNGLHALLPRLSLTYSNWMPDQDILPGTSFTFRAGGGRYSGGFQTVWISNSYANTGITSLTAYGYPGQGTFSSVPTVMPKDHQEWLNDLNTGPLSTATVASTSTVNVILPSFKMPTSWRMNLGTDIVFGNGFLGDGWMFSADMLFINFENQPYWTNLRVRESGAKAPDGRAMYEWTFDTGHVDPVTKGKLTGTDLAMGSKTGGGGTYIITQIQKDWNDTGYGDFSWKFGYTHSKGSEVSPETSSTASSSYSYHAGVNYNEPETGTSVYQRDHRFTTSLSISEKLWGELATRFNIFATKMSGVHYSLAFKNSPTGVNGSIFGPAGNSFYNSLLYIPKADGNGNVTATSDPLVSYSGSMDVNAFNTMLKQTGLIKYAGRVIPRGTQQGPWSSLINVGLEQELPTVFEGHNLVASFNIFNVGNLLNPKWGQFEYPSFFQAYEGATATIVNGKYVFSGFKSAADIKANNYRVTRTSSTYQLKFGIRYEF